MFEFVTLAITSPSPSEVAIISPQAKVVVGLILVSVVFVFVEYLALKLARHDDDHYDIRETAASFGVAAGDVGSRLATSGLVAIPLLAAYHVRLFDLSLDHPLSWVALFAGVEFCYYWFHRASHRIRWLWATHSVHHSATRFNLSAAMRLGWTGQISGAFLFFLPLAWIGFHPLAIGLVIALSLLYQFFLHTSFDVSFGSLEWVLNTPRHHRVHHASNDGCLDRNYGSVLIIWDRLFGTFAEAPAGEPLRYGLKGVAATNNVLAIAFGEWARMLRDVWKARTWRERWQALAGPPR